MANPREPGREADRTARPGSGEATAAAAEVERLRREITDAVAALEALLLAWRKHYPTDRDPGEVKDALEAVVRRLRGALAGTDAGADEVVDVLEQLQDEFERGE